MSQHRREAFARQRGSRGHSDHGFFLSLWHGSAAVEACWSPCKTLRVAVAMPERFSVLDFFPAADGWCCFLDRKSTRLNSSHGYISYAVFCLKKKKRSILAHCLIPR